MGENGVKRLINWNYNWKTISIQKRIWTSSHSEKLSNTSTTRTSISSHRQQRIYKINIETLRTNFRRKCASKRKQVVLHLTIQTWTGSSMNLLIWRNLPMILSSRKLIKLPRKRWEPGQGTRYPKAIHKGSLRKVTPLKRGEYDSEWKDGKGDGNEREFFENDASKYGQAGYEDGLHYGECHQYAEPCVLTNGVLSRKILKAIWA